MCLCIVHIRQVWCTVKISQDKEAEVGLNASFKFYFDASLEDEEAETGLDTSSEFH